MGPTHHSYSFLNLLIKLCIGNRCGAATWGRMSKGSTRVAVPIDGTHHLLGQQYGWTRSAIRSGGSARAKVEDDREVDTPEMLTWTKCEKVDEDRARGKCCGFGVTRGGVGQVAPPTKASQMVVLGGGVSTGHRCGRGIRLWCIGRGDVGIFSTITM